MTKGIAAVPVVNVDAIETALEFYVGTLGFAKAFQVGSYAGVEWGDAMIHVNGGSDTFNAKPTSVRVTIDGIDEYYAKLNALSLVKKDEHLGETGFGHRQFSVLDPSGNRVTFVQFGT